MFKLLPFSNNVFVMVAVVVVLSSPGRPDEMMEFVMETDGALAIMKGNEANVLGFRVNVTRSRAKEEVLAERAVPKSTLMVKFDNCTTLVEEPVICKANMPAFAVMMQASRVEAPRIMRGLGGP